YFVFFFFSSRRRHTRWPRDWSSDVCSSDLMSGPGFRVALWLPVCAMAFARPSWGQESGSARWRLTGAWLAVGPNAPFLTRLGTKIGRASCREKVEVAVGGVGVKEEIREVDV